MNAYDVCVCKANSIHNSEVGEEGLHTFLLAYYVKYFCSIYGCFRDFSRELLNVGEWKVSRIGHFTFRERASRRLGGPRASLDTV